MRPTHTIRTFAAGFGWLLLAWAGFTAGILLLGGCVSRHVAPPAPEQIATAPGREAEPQWNTVRARGPYIRGADVWVKPGYAPGTEPIPQPTDSLYVRARVYGVGGMPWGSQLMLNTDSDHSTGNPNAGLGSEYVACFWEADASGRFPIRDATVHVESNPGGWGPISGYGLLVTTPGSLRTSIPLSAFRNYAFYGWMTMRLNVFIGAGNWSDVSGVSFYAFEDLHTYPYADTIPDWHPPADDDPSAERSIASHVRR